MWWAGPGPGAGAAAARVRVRVRGEVRVGDVVEGFEAVAPAGLEVELEVEVRVAVLLVEAPALLDDLVDLGAAEGGGFVV